ncbi:MAG: hypothetical protein KDE27_04335 [Planctomycetes bacterium]|nr:hypothetical protein [Planctomycetota bacterium]
MSEKDDEEIEVATDAGAGEQSSPAAAAANDGPAAAEPISDLMGSGDAPGATARPKPDLDAEAMRAAQAAIAEGERALAAARAQLAGDATPRRAPNRRRELALRLLLAANVLAMLVVMALPSSPNAPGSPANQEAAHPVTTEPATGSHDPAPAGPRLADKYNQALLASENREYAKAIALLEEYLGESKRMPASRLVNVYRAMAHYSTLIGHFREAQDYERRAQAVTQSHSLPEDLVAMAKAAAEGNDQESLRQVWARFLLQQRQVPSSLYHHVAEAYLQLGDSYRVQANDAAEQARIEELRRAEELLRQQAAKGKER